MTDMNELEKLSIFLETTSNNYKTAKSYVKGKTAERFEQISKDYQRFDCILHDYLKVKEQCFVKEDKN